MTHPNTPTPTDRWLTSLGTPALLLGAALALALPQVAQAHCLVAGSPGAGVATADGTPVPVPSTVADCSVLRLIKGTATALWALPDGKTTAVPLRSDGPPAGYAGQATSPRPAQRLLQVASVATASGASARPGYKRAGVTPEAFEVFVPPGGLTLGLCEARQWHVVGLQAEQDRLLTPTEGHSGARFTIPAAWFGAFGPLRVSIQTEQGAREWVLRSLEPDTQAALEREWAGFQSRADLDESGRRWAQALVFDQIGLSLNRDQALAANSCR